MSIVNRSGKNVSICLDCFTLEMTKELNVHYLSSILSAKGCNERYETATAASPYLLRDYTYPTSHCSLVVYFVFLLKQVIFRSDPNKYQNLRRALDEFAGFLTRPISLIKDIDKVDWNQVVEQVFNWQETATSFIDRLSSDYSEYVDITQPIQVSVYEMKMGLSLFVSGALLGKILSRFDIDTVESVMVLNLLFIKNVGTKSLQETIYALMRFPRSSSFASATYIESLPPLHLSHYADYRAKSLGLDVGLLHKLISVSSADDTRKISELQLKTALYKNQHARVAHFVANTGLMDKASFEILDSIYFELARNWMEMKYQVRTRADALFGLYKFRSRDFKIESVMEVDISALGKYFPSDSFSEWQEYLADDDMKLLTQTDQGDENLEDDWDLIQKHVDNMYIAHIMSYLVSVTSMKRCITDSRRLDSFTDSYELRINMIKGLKGLFTSSLDAKLVPEHLLRLCKEYKKTFTSHGQSACKYNFYKNMRTILVFKNSDILRMLMDIPSRTLLAKALSGLQFLICKVQKLQEEGCKLPVSDLLEPIISLASSWQKLEFECWPTLLDEVQDQYELSARKLWLPLFSVLFQKDCVEFLEHENESISQSLVEFIETSNIGEFKRRLELLLCFLLHLSMGSSLGVYSSVMEQLDLNRKNVEAELKEHLKLCRWERPDNHLLIETTKRTRQKVKKLIQNFTDMLRRPVMLDRTNLAKERVQFLPLLGPDLMNGASNMRVDVLVSNLDAEQVNDRFSWYAVWRKKVKESVGRFHQEMHFKELLRGEDHQYPPPVYQGDWKFLWSTVSKIGEKIASCSDLWRNCDRDVAKKRALPDLLKSLEKCGLQKHKYENVEMSNHFKELLYQPAYDPNHLLLLTDAKSSIHTSRVVEDQNKESSVAEWRAANEFYFKSLASVQLMLNIERKHSDITSEQQLIDNFSAMLLSELALLRTVGSTHLDSCQTASLDRLLLDSNGFIITPRSSRNQFVTQHMVKLLCHNFNQLTDLENQISAFCEDNEKTYAINVLLSHFASVFKEVSHLYQSTGMEPKEQSALEANLANAFENVKDVIGKLCSYKDGSVSQEEEGNITIWDGLLKKAKNDLNLDNLCKLLSETFGSIEQLLNSSGVLSACVGDQLKQLQAFLELLLNFGDSCLQEFLAISKTGLASPKTMKMMALKMKNQKLQKVLEWERAKDVSDQIEDEDQLRGKEEEEKEQDTPDNVLDKNKGIEMTDEFEGKEYSLSEDSEEDKEDEESEDEQLDSKLGDAGSDAEKADEKPWGKDEDEEAGNKNEKNESGPSVADKDTSSRELRAKDDDDEIQNQNEALADTSGPTPELDNEQTDDAMEIEKQMSQDPAEKTTEAGAEDVSEAPQKDPGNDLEQKCETEPTEGKEVVMSEDMKPNVCNDNISDVNAGSHNPHGFNGLGAGSTAPQENLAATNVSDELTDSMDPPSGRNTEMNFTMTSMASGETLTDSIPKMEFPQSQSSISTTQDIEALPRTLGDVQRQWFELMQSSRD
ncbi:hypothetical protein F2Q69_00030329 [Brassica cretica]|uniref:VWFA domain-containing protein n=1 Tax=Brassica cretica TaxID=69181 RepID=A0A8S9S6U5_BRACR|nr:hypothetical protein F2Q69_00030329 [Brassica cretica]